MAGTAVCMTIACMQPTQLHNSPSLGLLGPTAAEPHTATVRVPGAAAVVPLPVNNTFELR